MTIGFVRLMPIGDIIVVLHALYALRALYPESKITFYTTSNGVSLCRHFDFIDTLINAESFATDGLLAHINNCHFDILLLPSINRYIARDFECANAKRIITFGVFRAAISRHFECVYIPRMLCRMSQYQRILRLVKKINPAHFNAHIKSIDFSPIRFQATRANKQKVRDFLRESGISKPLVVVNPFVASTACNLTLAGYAELVRALAAQYPHISFVIPTYAGNADFAPILAGGGGIHTIVRFRAM